MKAQLVERAEVLAIILLFIIAMILFQIGFMMLEDHGFSIRRTEASQLVSPLNP